jgi:hypothetical protein
MGYTRFNFALNVMIQPSTAGGLMSTSSYVSRGFGGFHKLLWDPLMGDALWVENFGTPPWGDSPFTLHFFETGTMLPPKGHYARKSRAIRDAGVVYPIPHPVFEAPPTTEPVEVGKHFEHLPYHDAARRRAKLTIALRSVSEAPGRWNAFLNATEYSADSCHMLEEIQRHVLIEPPDQGVSWDLWSQSEVLGYFNQRLTRFIQATGCVKKRQTSTHSTALVDLPSDLLELRRVAWDGVGLPASDPQSLDFGRPGWDSESGTPITYIEEPMNPLQVKLVPAPSSSGTLELHYIPKPDALTSACTKLPLPNFMAFYVKWGVLADMLKKDGPANDPQRATYAEGRFMEGIQLVKALLGAVA